MSKPGRGERWTDAECQLLRQLIAADESYEVIQRRLHRTYEALRKACKRWGLPAPRHDRTYPRDYAESDSPSASLPLWRAHKKTARQHWLAVRSAMTINERRAYWLRIPPALYGEVILAATVMQ